MADIYLYNNEMWRVKYKFTYTGQKDRFTILPGRFLCICKGANGGKAGESYANKGGCSYGILNLESPLTAYAVVGGDGGDGSMSVAGAGGYNGGGNGSHSCYEGTYAHGAGGGGASDIRLSNRDVEEVQYTSQIPDGFDEVEYIESDETQYMDIGINFVPTTKIETGAYIGQNTVSPYPTLFGTRTATQNNCLFFFIKVPGGNRPYYGCGNQETPGTLNTLPSGEWLKITQEGSTIKWYDTTDTEVGSITSGGTLGTGEYPMYLFDLDQAGSPHPSSNSCKSAARIKYFKMWNNDQLVRYLVPFKNPGTIIDLSEFVFEQGNILDYGDSPSSTRIRTRGYIPLASGTRYLAGFPTGMKTMKVNFMTYSNEQSLIADLGWVNSGEIVDIGSNVGYVRICICNENGSDIAPSDMETFELRKYDTNIKSGLYDLVSGNMYGKSSGNDFVTGDVVSDKTVYTVTESINIGLMSRIMVAGGGGGQGWMNANDSSYSNFTGFGGGLFGGYPCTKSGLIHNHLAPNQVEGYEFGQGENGIDKNPSTSPATWGAEGIAGGGGGWYGGYTSNVVNPGESYSTCNGGGGSGYVLTETSYKPTAYMAGLPERYDLNFEAPLMTAGLANESCVLICEKVFAYSSGDRIICDCIGTGTEFILYPGTYRLKCAGGQGSNRTRINGGKRGGYAEGVLNNPSITRAFAYVGGSGLYASANQNASYVQQTHPTHCFNGGGKPSSYGDIRTGAEAAGGGTDIRIGEDSLYARIIVAGGAGGCGKSDGFGGAGGGESGELYYNGGYGDNGGPGTQTAAGANSGDRGGGFGYGGNGASWSYGFGGAGGGGWYGGSGTGPDGSSDDDKGGCGGSGYVLTETSYKPTGYLLNEDYYLTDTQLTTGGQELLCSAPITGIVIDVISAATSPIIAHDNEGYKYFDTEAQEWTFLKSEDITLEDFEEYGTSVFANDMGLEESYDLYVYDEHDVANTMVFNVLPPRGDVKFRYHTEHMMSRYNLDADVDETAVDFQVDAKRRGVAEDAYIYFTFNYNLHDIPEKDTRVYCIQGFTQGASLEYHEPRKKEKTLEHIDLLPVGSATRMPARFKNYIGSFINGSEAITTINSAVVCEHNRCIYSATLCNDSVVRFAKLNLVNNTSTVIKDIPKSQLGNTYYGDIKVDDDYIYITSSSNDSMWSIWRTRNSADTTVNTFSMPNDNDHRIQAVGRMEWYDGHTLMLMMRKGLALFDTRTGVFSYRWCPDGTQNGSRRDYALGERYVLSLYSEASSSAFVIDAETGDCVALRDEYGQEWAGTYLNSVCFHDGIFYVVQRNRLHYLDEKTMTITFSIPTPFTDIDPKQIVYGNGVLYITIQNSPSLYMYDIATQTFYATGLPFKMDNWNSNGWIRMCAFRGYCFVPQIRLYTINFVDRAKYNLGYKYDQFVIIMNEENSLIPDNQYEYDERFVTFTEDNMWLHAGDIHVPMEEVDPVNHIKLVPMSKDQYNKIISVGYTNVDPEDEDESEGT